MRYGKGFLGLFTALLLLLIAVGGYAEYSADPLDVQVQIAGPGGRETVALWENAEGDYFLFLPAYAELSQVTLQNKGFFPVYLEGVPLDGQSCADLALNQPYTLSWQRGFQQKTDFLTILRSENVPVLYLDTGSGNMDYVHAKKGNAEAGNLRLYTSSGDLDYRGDLESISGRGNSTWDWDKKPYSLTLNAAGDLLGMGAAQNWILLANALDPTQVRNKIIYDFAQTIGLAYSPEVRWVDLYLNGEYAGLYLLCERNEIHSQRVDIPPETSFLVSKDWEWRMAEREQPFVTTASGAAFRIRNNGGSEADLLAVLQSVENAILSPEGIDPDTGKTWQELIDLDSWVKKYLLEEVFGNADGVGLSQFFYYLADTEKLYSGPAWDYDLALGNYLAIQSEYPNQLFAARPNVWGSPWLPALYEKAEFYEKVQLEYETTFLPALQELLDQGIAQYLETIAVAKTVDRIRWSAIVLEEDAEMLPQYLRQRMEFLEDLWLKEKEFVRLNVKGYDGARNTYLLSPGELPPKLLSYDYVENVEFEGWFYEGTDIPFRAEEPITQDTNIQLRYTATAASGQEAEDAPSILRNAPAAVLIGLLGLLCGTEVWQRKRSVVREHEPRKEHQISP